MPYKDKCKQAEYWQKNKERFAKRHKNTRQYYKKQALIYYGNGELACVKCGYKDVRALSIDHIDGNGINHRKIYGSSGLYRWLIKQGYPNGFQTLCMNCQYIKRAVNKEYYPFST